MKTRTEKLRRIKRLLALFIVLLILSGLTAFPTVTELNFLNAHAALIPSVARGWISQVCNSLNEVDATKPYLLYGFDWLAFAHIIIGLFFIGALKNPVRNAWVLRTGMLACIGVFPLAFICGPIRGIPIGWTLIDCSFGVFGFALLYYIHSQITKLKFKSC